MGAGAYGQGRAVALLIEVSESMFREGCDSYALECLDLARRALIGSYHPAGPCIEAARRAVEENQTGLARRQVRGALALLGVD